MIIQNNWNKYTRIFVILICVFSTLLLSGCIFGFIGDVRRNFGEYKGDYPELYSVAINSVLGTRGYYDYGHGRYQSRIHFVEKDSSGRMMFIYYERNKISNYSLIINQKSDGEYTYYYPDYNFISTSTPVKSFSQTKLDSSEKFDASGDKSYTLIPSEDVLNPALEYFSYEDIEKLKRRNDWNMDIDIGKCEKAKIVRQKEKGPVRSWTIEEFYRKALGNDAFYKEYIVFSIKDGYNRSMYVGYGKYGKRTTGQRIVVMFFQPDGSYDEKNGVMELTDLNNYQDDLKAFKELNNWNVKP